LDDGVNRKTVKGFSGSRGCEEPRGTERCRYGRPTFYPMNAFTVCLAGLSALFLSGGCMLKPPSPRASVDPTPPGQLIDERNLAESKRAYYERLKERATAIYHDKNLSSYAAAEAIAAQEIGPPPTGRTWHQSLSTEDQRAVEQARKSDKYKKDLKAAAEEVSSQRSR
jgi:hypothetical protein